MSEKCIFCENDIFKRKLCKEHYDQMVKYKFEFVNLKASKNEMKGHYHNLRFSIMKQKKLLYCEQSCLRLIAMSEAYLMLYNDSSLVEKAYIFSTETYMRKVANNENNLKEERIILSDKKAEIDFRQRWSCDYICDDGHKVRSLSELLIDNWLFYHKISHCYEKYIFLDKQDNAILIPDFYLNDYNTYIEYWGKYTNEYITRKEAKISIYEKNGISYIGLFHEDIKNLDFVLSAKIKTLNK